MSGSITQEQREFANYIKIVGRGKRSGDYLSLEQAERAMTLALQNHVSAEQLGAFLMLLRMREESVDELGGFLLACRQTLSSSLNALPVADLDLGCYGGKRRHLPWLVLAVLVLVQNGYRVFIHGTKEPDSGRLYLDHVWSAFGWQPAKTALQATKMVEENGFCYMDLSDIHSGMYQHIQLRELFGLRSCMNTLARMLNPSRSRASMHGVFHKHFDERHVAVAERLDENNVACFRGDGGEVEVNPEREFQLYYRQHGIVRTLVFPELLDRWQFKPRALMPTDMIPIWEGKSSDQYGEQAVIGTLATYLILLESLDAEHALLRAKSLWESREKSWPKCHHLKVVDAL